jgi:hypothetical protein
VVGCGEKQGTTQSTEADGTTGVVSSSTDAIGTTGTEMSTTIDATGNPICQAIPSTPCGDYIGALACCGVESVDDEAGAFLTEDCVAYIEAAPDECGALVTASLVCLRPLPCADLLAFRAAYEAGDEAWKTDVCGEQVKAAMAATCAEWWAVK